MNISSIGTGYLLLILFVINFLLILLIRSEGRYWFTGVVLWMLLFFIVVMFSVMNGRVVESQEFEYSELTTMNEHQSMQLEQLRKQTGDENTVLFSLLGFQTIFSFIWQIIGSKTTTKGYYRSSVISFTLLTIIYGIIELVRII